MKDNLVQNPPTNPWGEYETNSVPSEKTLLFDDSFSDTFVSNGADHGTTYVPLDDSQQYLAGLEKKLARLQGKNASQRESERKKLISALAKSREDHARNFLNSDSNTCALNDDMEESGAENLSLNKGLTSINAVDPQGTLGLVMRKCAPEHVALSAEELCELLKADMVAKVYEELHPDDAVDDVSPEDDAEVAKEEEEDSLHANLDT